MKGIFRLLVGPVLLLLPCMLAAQQKAVIIDRCGGVDSITIPAIIDNDRDGMDDRLEQKLLNYFMPVIIQYDNENCPGPEWYRRFEPGGMSYLSLAGAIQHGCYQPRFP